MKKATATSFIQDLLLRITRQNQALDLMLTINSTLLRKRYRDMSLDDNLGLFDAYGTWTPLGDARNFYTLNVIKPMIKATTAAIITADYKIKIVPRAAKNSQSEMAVEVAKAIRDLKTEQQWTSQLSERIAVEPQIAAGVFLKTEWNPYKKNPIKSSIDEWEDEEISVGGKAVCGSCGYETSVGTMPEQPETILEQVRAALSPESSRLAVLATNGAEGIPAETASLFVPLEVEEGTLYVNPQKLETVGLTAEDLPAFVQSNGYAALLGKVEDHTGDTSDGAVVRTTDENGLELNASVVKSPENLPVQAQMDAAQFPDQQVQQDITDVDSTVQGRNEFPSAVCEHCGGQAEILEQGQTETVPVRAQGRTFNSGDTETTIVPAAEIVIDSKRTAGGNVKAARWLLHRYLVPSAELDAEYDEGSNVSAGNLEWSFPLRWQYAFETGNDDVFRDDSATVDDDRQVNDLYLTPQMYRHIELNDEFIVGERENPRFYVEYGKSFAEGIFNGKPLAEMFEDAPVLCFRTVGTSIVDVFPSDFREKFVYISFLSNPSNFWSLFLTEMLPLQDVINYMWTVQVFHTRRNARTTKIANSGAFNPEDFEKDIVLTKEPLPYDANIGNTFGIVPSATLSSAPMELIQTAIGVRGDVGGVQPAMMGQPAPGEPYAAQRQQKEMALGQLIPFSRSIALAKTAWTIRQIKDVQENASMEDFLFLLKIHEEWTEEYVEAFLDCNIDTDLLIDYERGSESPRSLFERESALRQFIQDVLTLAQLNPQIAEPELINDILQNIAQIAQLDIDVGNNEAEIRVANTRFNKITHIVETMPPMPPGTPPEMIEMAAMQIVMLPGLMPSEYEDAGTEVEFWRDKINREMAMEEPNFMLIACFEAMIKAHKQAAVSLAQEDLQAQMAAQAPAMQMQQEQQAQQMQQQQEQEQQATAQTQEQDGAAMREQRDHERKSKLEDAQLAAMEREHTAELAARSAK